MPGTRPQETFREVREACRTQAWERLYACLVARSVRRLAANSLLRSLAGRSGGPDAAAMKRICREVGADAAWVDAWAVRRARIRHSYAELRAGGSVGDELRGLAERHRQLILQDERETERMGPGRSGRPHRDRWGRW